jgi:hypothetical protein
MTDETTFESPTPPQRRSPGRPRLHPLREEPIRTATARESKINDALGRARSKTRTRTGAHYDKFHIPPNLIPDGVSLQWITHENAGKPEMQRVQGFLANGWEPVPADWFPGMFMPETATEHITVEGLGLYWRPMELTLQAREEEQLAALRAVRGNEERMLGGVADAIKLDTQHPSARRVTGLRRSTERYIPIPEDDEE